MRTVTKPAGTLVLVLACGALVRCGADSSEATDSTSHDASADAPTDAPPDQQHPDGVADHSVQDAPVDAPADAPTDALPDEQQPDSPGPLTGCETLATEWSAFVAGHRACSSASDCSVVGGAGGPMSWCTNCWPSIGDASGDAIVKSALSQAEPYLTKFHACVDAGLWKGCTWDAAPAKNLRCEGGVCKADPGYCFGSASDANANPDGAG